MHIYVIVSQLDISAKARNSLNGNCGSSGRSLLYVNGVVHYIAISSSKRET